jgi:hypothetical protein
MRDLEVAKTTLPISIWGVPEQKWAGRLEYSHMGSPRFRIEFVSIWGSGTANISWYVFSEKLHHFWELPNTNLLGLFEVTGRNTIFSIL